MSEVELSGMQQILSKLDTMSGEIHDIKTHQHKMAEELETVKRGIYGDQQNQVKGLIQTDIEQGKALEDHRQRISNLEDFINNSKAFITNGWKVIVFVAGSVSGIIAFIVKYFS